MKTKYTVGKARGLWWVLDAEGYEVSYVGWETKREALEAAVTLTHRDSDWRAARKRNADRVDLGESGD